MTTDTDVHHVTARLSTLDRFLPVWIGLAMARGCCWAGSSRGWTPRWAAVEIDGISLPIAAGLLMMMYPVLAKVRYDRLDDVTRDTRVMAASLVLNWVVGPALMFALAWVLLPDLPEYRTGLIIVGLARCIAMVIIWNDLACGDREAAAVLVALNSIFQVVMFAALGWFYLRCCPAGSACRRPGIDRSTVADRQVGAHLPRDPPARRAILTRRMGRAGARAARVRAAVPAADRAVGALRPALHHRHSLRAAGRAITGRPWPRRADRAAAAGLLRADVGRRLSARGRALGLSTPARPRWRSPPPATTSNSPSPWRSPPSASPPGRRSPVSSARSSKCRCWSRLVYVSLALRDRFQESR
jgi:hypothetical protein